MHDITKRMICYNIKIYGIRKKGGKVIKGNEQRPSSVKNPGFESGTIYDGGNQR